jgi:UDP-glucose 4-epimerase
VIPLFAQAILDGRQPEIHGDGMQSRDFTYIDDVVAANRRAIAAPGEAVAGNVYNIAQGMSTTILDVWKALADLSGSDLEPVFTSPRPGDVRTSRANTEAAERDLGFTPGISVAEGLERSWSWMSSR